MADVSECGSLHRVAIALKDLSFSKAGVAHSFGSKLLDGLGYVADRTPAVVERIEAGGAIVIENTNTSAFGRETHHIVLGPLTRTVADSAVLMDVIAGPYVRDPPVLMDFELALDRPIDDLEIAYGPGLNGFRGRPVRRLGGRRGANLVWGCRRHGRGGRGGARV